MSEATQPQSPPPSPTTVSVNWRAVALLLSVAPLIALRDHRLALLIYSGVVSTLLLAAILLLPRRVARAERTFARDSLKALALHDFDGLRRLVAAQRLLRIAGRKHVLPEALGLCAQAEGKPDEARAHYALALRTAPADERVRIEVNLAGAELAAGRLIEAEGHCRAVLRRRPDMPVALVHLGHALVRRGAPTDDRAALVEGLTLLDRALPMADPRELGGLQLARAQAILGLRGRRDEAAAALDAAAAAGADPEAVGALRARL